MVMMCIFDLCGHYGGSTHPLLDSSSCTTEQHNGRGKFVAEPILIAYIYTTITSVIDGMHGVRSHNAFQFTHQF
jgi:hypothetical protein